jgi:integrase/recombinase XerD
MSVSIAIILDTRRIKENKTYPIKLRVNFKRVTNYYNTIYNITLVDYQKLSATRISADLATIRDKLKELERTSEAAAKEIEPFSFDAFQRKFIQQQPCLQQRKLKMPTVINGAFDFDYSPFHKKFPILLEACDNAATLTSNYKSYIQNLLREGRIGSAVSYNCSYVSLKKFAGNVPLTAITASFLIEYEQCQKSNNISKSTIGIYLRPLRAIFNEAIEAGIISRQKNYPFGRRKYQIPTSRNVKKALDLNDIEKIYNYQCCAGNENEQRAKDFWLFSYFGNGMNPKDIANLKYKNINDDYLTFERSKTERSMRSDPKPITVFISEDMHAIINRWGNKDRASNNYIFPILETCCSPLRQYQLVQNFIGVINDWMKHILKQLGIDKKATTYVARHSFSTILKRSGASTEFIQEALGHSHLKTTEYYLGSFDKEVKKEFAGRLTSFKREAVNQL